MKRKDLTAKDIKQIRMDKALIIVLVFMIIGIIIIRIIVAVIITRRIIRTAVILVRIIRNPAHSGLLTNNIVNSFHII